MYVLARHEGESIIIADVIEIKVLSVTGKIARLGIDAPKEVPVKRAEKHHTAKDNDDKD